MVFLSNALSLWTSSGIFDTALPLVLFFAIIFSILHRTKILGENKVIDAVVSFIISLFIILNPLTAPFLAEVFSRTGVALILFVASLIILGLFTDRKKMEGPFKWIGALAGAGFFIWLIILMNDFYNIYTWFPIAYYGIDFWDIAVGVVVLGTVIATVALAKDENETATKRV